MERSRRLVARFLVTVACTLAFAQGCTSPSSSSSSAQPGFQPPIAAVGEVWTDVPADVVAELRALQAAVPPALKACEDGPLRGLTPDKAVAAPFPFDRAQLDAGCGPAGSLFDAHRALLGRSRTGDTLLSHVARVADDLDYLRRTVGSEQPAVERGNAVKHVRDAIRYAYEAVEQLGDGPIWPYHSVGSTQADGWRNLVDGVHTSLVRLNDNLGNLAYTQGVDPAAVRGRMLESFFVGAEVDGAVRERTLPAIALSDEERAARKAYQEVELTTLRTLRAIELAYVHGEVTSLAARSERIASADRALAAYEAAWAAEAARIGLAPAGTAGR